MKELSASIVRHMLTKRWIEPNYVTVAVAGIAIFGVRFELEGVVITSVVLCLLFLCLGGFELILITGNIGESLVDRSRYHVDDVAWMIGFSIDVHVELFGFVGGMICPGGEGNV
jgi:hypothetical protein